MEHRITLPSGSNEFVALMNECSSKLLVKLFQKVLTVVDREDQGATFSSDEQHQLAEGLQLNVTQANALISLSIYIFRQLAMIPSEDIAISQLSQSGLGVNVCELFVAVWNSEHGRNALRRMSEVTHSGLPRMTYVSFAVTKAVDRTCENGKNLVRITIGTNGRRPIYKVFTPEQVRALYEKTNEMQREIEQLLE